MTPSPLSYLVASVAERCTTIAVHEAGHAIAGRSYGVTAEATLLMEGAALSGYTEYSHGLTGQQFRVVSLAGGIAVELWYRPDVTVEQLIEEKWTPTSRDAEDAGDYGADDLAECLEIMRSHWRDVEAEAALLLQGLLGVRNAPAADGFFNTRALFPDADEPAPAAVSR